MPFMSNTRGLAFNSFPHKATSFVTAYGADVVRKNTQIYPVQLKGAEGVAKDKLDGITTKSTA